MTIETFDQYRALAMRTDDLTRTPEQRLHNAALGLLGEFGEVADLFKKHLYHGHPLDSDKLAKELGDLCWYLSVVADVYSLHRITKTNFEYVGVLDLNRVINDLRYSIWHMVDRVYSGYGFVGVHHIESLMQDIEVISFGFCSNPDGTPMSIQDIWKLNVTKLQQRYPDGFSSEASINRVV